MHRTAFVLIAAAMTAALAGCVDAVIVYGDRSYARDTYEELVLAGTMGPLPVIVRGNPFAADKARFDAAVIAGLNASQYAGQVQFAIGTEGSGPGRYHVVLVFNPPGPFSAAELCRGDWRNAPIALGSTRTVSGAFCQQNIGLTEAKAQVGNVSGPDDPKLQALVKQLAIGLFPRYHEPENNDDRASLRPRYKLG